MARIVPQDESTQEKEVEISPVGTPATGKQKAENKDGFIKGQVIEPKDYFKFMAEQRLKK